MINTARQYTVEDLEGLKFYISDEERIKKGVKLVERRYTITSIKAGDCWVGWDNIADRVPYAVHCVLKYLNTGIWYER